ARTWGRGIAKGGQRSLRAIAGEDVGPDDRHETSKDEDAVARLPEEDREAAGEREEDDEGFHDGASDRAKHGRRWAGFELVRAVPRKANRELIGLQAPLRVHSQVRGDGRARERVWRRWSRVR